jgi:hypothetical protein
MNRYESEWWSAELPEGWIVEEDLVSTSFYQPAGVGALQVSVVRKDSGDVTESDLQAFLAEQYADGEASEAVTIGALEGVQRSWVEDDTAWHTWYLHSGPFLFCVTYNCGLEDVESESEATLAILGSITTKL